MRHEFHIWLGVALFSAITPIVLPTYYWFLVVQVLVFGLLATSLDILIGYLGVTSLGQAMFFGIAGYAAAGLLLSGITQLLLNLLICLLATLVVSGTFSYLVRSARGGYFFMITLAFNQVFWALAYGLIPITGGEYGLADIPRPVIAGLNLGNGTILYYFIALLCLLGLGVTRCALRSPFGLILRGFKSSELRMASLGYNDFAYRTAAYCLSGFMAGLAGACWVYYNAFVSPANLGLDTSANALFMTLIGGSGTAFGPLLGSAILVTSETLLTAYTGHWQLLMGIVFILVALFRPGGLIRMHQ